MPPCSRLSRRGLETSEYASTAERRPALTASARAGVRNLRSGRKKACRRGRTKERRRNKKARKKALAFVAAIRERRNGLSDRTKKLTKDKNMRCTAEPLDKRSPIQGSPPGFDIAYPETRTPAANSGSWGEADVVSKVLDATSELGNDAGLVAFDKKIGAEVLVECAILEHVVGGSQQRGR